MKAYVSLHTAKPQAQIDNEAFYQGYHRMPVDFHEKLGDIPVGVTFPIIEVSSPDVVTHIAIGREEKGQGELFMLVPILPYIPLVDDPNRRNTDWWMEQATLVNQPMTMEQAKHMVENHGYTAPFVSIGNSNPVDLPPNLNPIARIAHQLIFSGLLHASELHPKLYEAINDALLSAGVPIIPVVRSGAAHMTGKMSNLASLSDWNPSAPPN